MIYLFFSFFGEGYRAFTEATDGSMCLAMEYGGEKSLSDLIEERNAARLGPFPAATIFKVALSMARGLKVRCGAGETTPIPWG